MAFVPRATNPLLQHWLRSTTLVGLSALLLITAPVAAWAQQRPTTPFGKPNVPPGDSVGLNASQTFSYNTNPLKLVNGGKSLYGSDTAVSIIINSHTPTRIVQLNSIVSQGYYDDSNFDTTNAHEILTLGKKNQRWNFGLGGRFDYETTRTTEITSFGISAPNVRNVKLAASPEIGFKVTPLDTLGLKATALDSSYDNNSFIDYRTYEVTPSWLHKFDQRNTGVLTFNTQRYKTLQGIETTVTTVGPSLGWIWDYSDNLTARLDAGAQRSTQERANSAIKTSDTNYTFSGNLKYTTEESLTDFTISRAQRPSGNGVSFLMTNFDLKESYLVNDRVSLQGGAGYRYATYITNPGVNLDHEYTGSGGVAYRLFRNIDLTANYQYSKQQLTSGNGKLSAHSVLLGLSFHPSEAAF